VKKGEEDRDPTGKRVLGRGSRASALCEGGKGQQASSSSASRGVRKREKRIGMEFRRQIKRGKKKTRMITVQGAKKAKGNRLIS